MIKERAWAKFVSVILSILMFICLFGGVTIIVAYNTILNVDYYNEVLLTNKMIDCFIDNSNIFQNSRWNEKALTDNFIRHYVKDSIIASIYNDDSVFDNDYYDDYIRNNMNALYELSHNSPMSEERIAALKKDLKSGVPEIRKSVDNIDDLKPILEFGKIADYVGYGLVLLAFILDLIIFAIYNNKFRAIRNFAIASFIAVAIDLTILIVGRIFILRAVDDNMPREVERKIRNTVLTTLSDNLFTSIIFVLGITCAVTFVMMVILCVLAHKKNNVVDNSNEAPQKVKSPKPKKVDKAFIEEKANSTTESITTKKVAPTKTLESNSVSEKNSQMKKIQYAEMPVQNSYVTSNGYSSNSMPQTQHFPAAYSNQYGQVNQSYSNMQMQQPVQKVQYVPQQNMARAYYRENSYTPSYNPSYNHSYNPSYMPATQPMNPNYYQAQYPQPNTQQMPSGQMEGIQYATPIEYAEPSYIPKYMSQTESQNNSANNYFDNNAEL